MYDFQKRTMFLQKWISNLQDLPRTQSLETIAVCSLTVLPTWQCCLYSHVWWIYEINRFWRLSQASVHSVIDRANFFTEERTSDRPKRAKYKHFRTIREQTCDKFSNRFQFFFFKVVVIDAWSRYSKSCCVVLQTHNIAPHTSLHDQPCHETMKKCDCFEGMVISPILPQRFAIRTWFLQLSTVSLLVWHCPSSAFQVHMLEERCWFSQIDLFVEYPARRAELSP